MCKDDKNKKDIKDKLADAFRTKVRSVAGGVSDLVRATATDPFDVSHGLDVVHEKDRIRKNLAKAVVYRKATGAGRTPQVHVLEGHGPLGTDTVVVDKGQEFGAIVAGSATVDGRRVGFYDVAGSPVAFVNTESAIMDWLGEHGDEYMVNSDVFAEFGSSTHVLSQFGVSDEFTEFMDSLPATSIGVVVSDFTPIDPTKRYEVINPIVAAVTLLGARAAALAGTAVTATVHAPSELAEGVRSTGENVKVLVEQGEGARELVGESGDGLSVGERLFLVEFHPTGMAPKPHGVPSASATIPCDTTVVVNRTGCMAVRLDKVAQRVRTLISGLPAT